MVAKCAVVVKLVVPSPVYTGCIGNRTEVGLVFLVVSRTYIITLFDTCCIEDALALVRVVRREGGCKLQSLDDVGTQIEVTHQSVHLSLIGVVAVIQIDERVICRCKLCVRTKGSLCSRVRNQVAICICRRYEWVEIERIHVWRISTISTYIFGAAH